MNSIGIQLRISDMLFAVQKRWKIIASLTFLGLVFGVLLSGMNYVQSAVETYQINGSFTINAVDKQGRYSGNSIAPSRTDMTMATEMYDTVYYLLRSDRLLYKVINDQQLLGVSVSDLRNGLSISQYNETNIITMKLTWDNGEEGYDLWQAIVQAANELLPEIVQVGHLQILNEAEARLISSRTANIKTWMVLPVLGFGAGVGFAIVELLMRPTLINVKDVETVFGLETIGIIPYDSEYYANKSSLLVADERSSSEVTQNFSAAAYILRNRIGLKEKCHCFYITSTTGQEGRTSVAANLAIQLSDMERHTLLIDFDYKNPMLGTLFLNNLDYSHSLNALYRGEITMADAITTLTGYLDILPMVMEHNLIYMDSAIIEMLSQLREQYQYIIIDAPPVGKESETLSLNQVANTVLFVARYDTASIPEIQATLEKLDKSGIRMLGCIVNGVKSSKNVILDDAKEEAAKKAKAASAKKKRRKKTLAGGKKEESKDTEETVRDLTEQDKKKKKKKTGKKTASKPAQTKAAKKPTIPYFEDIPEDGGKPAGDQASAPAQEKPVFFSGEQEAPKPAPDIAASVQWEQPTEPSHGMAGSEAVDQPVPVHAAAYQEPAEMNGDRPPAAGPKPPEDVPGYDTGSTEMSGFDTGPAETHGFEAVPAEAGQAEAPTPTADIIIMDPVVLSGDAEPIQAIPAEQPKAPEKKRGLFGRRPRAPEEAGKSEKEAPAEKTRPAKEKKAKTEPAKDKKTKAESVKEKKAKAELVKEKKGAPEAVEEKKAKAEPVKEKKAKAEPAAKKTGLFSWGKKKEKAPLPFDQIQTEATVINKTRDVFQDLMDDGPAEPVTKSDADMMEELLRMGLDGSWTKTEEKTPVGSAPKSGRRNIFDDL